MSDDHLQDLLENLERDAARFGLGVVVGLAIGAGAFLLGWALA